jgi:hypothetical protein
MNKNHPENAAFLDRVWSDFRAEVLNRIERSPTGFFDASFQVAVLGGKVTLQQGTYAQDGISVTDKYHHRG